MHLGTTQCCNHTFTAKDIQGRLMSQQEALGTNDVHLYGGNAKRFSNTICPECGTEYILWLKPEGGSYRVLTISRRKQPENTGDSSEINPDEPLESMNIYALRKLATAKGIKNPNFIRKAELIEQLRAV